jgi:hypothetical protein
VGIRAIFCGIGDMTKDIGAADLRILESLIAGEHSDFID